MITLSSACCNDLVEQYGFSTNASITKNETRRKVAGYIFWSALEVSGVVFAILGLLKIAPFNGISPVGCYCLLGTSAVLLLLDFCSEVVHRGTSAGVRKVRRETVSSTKEKHGAILVTHFGKPYIKDVNTKKEYRVWTPKNLREQAEHLKTFDTKKHIYACMPEGVSGIEFIEFEPGTVDGIIDLSDFLKAVNGQYTYFPPK